MIVLTRQTVAQLVEQAKQSSRRRQNLNIHLDTAAAINRLLNAVEPDSYVRPHRHPDKDETLLAVAGSFALLFFDNDARVTRREMLGGTGAALIEYPANTWHSLIALESGSVFFEVKAGPYVAVASEDYLPGWPLENSTDVPRALRWLGSAKPGDKLV